MCLNILGKDGGRRRGGSVRGAEISVSTLSCIVEVDPDLRCC